MRLQLAFSDQERQARQKFAAATGRQKTGKWKWVMACFTTTVHLLAPSEAGADELGRGARSLDAVQ